MAFRTYNEKRAEKRRVEQQLKAERRGKVVRFLRDNPLSTSEEIFKATGCGPGNAGGLLKSPMYNGRRVFRLNRRAIEEFNMA